MREWVIYALIMAVVFVLFFRNTAIGALAGVLVSGPLYLGFGYVMAKFGYQRTTLRQLREERPPPAERSEPSSTTRSRPAPTRRTSTGVNRPKGKKRRR